MTKNIIAIVILLIGAFGIIVLLTYGGPVLPHIIGPITLAVLGLALLLFKGKAK